MSRWTTRHCLCGGHAEQHGRPETAQGRSDQARLRTKYTFICLDGREQGGHRRREAPVRDLRRRGAQRHERSRAAGRPRGLRLLPKGGAGRLGRRLGADA